MTSTEARLRVRNLLDQKASSDTQYDDNDFIDEVVNQGRRMFARILPDQMLPDLRATASISLTTGAGDFPADYIRRQRSHRVQVDSVWATEISPDEMWRVKNINDNALTTADAEDKYWWEEDDGIFVLPTSSTTCSFPYVKAPGALSTTDNTDLPKDVEDLTIDFAFEKCMATQRGDLDLALHLARSRGFTVRSVFQNLRG